MSHSIFHHSHAHAPQTEGLVIHWGTPYDVLMPLATFGGMRRVHRRVVDLVEAKPGDAVLDVGCGPGNLALLLAQRVGPSGLAAGIDASPEMIARARRNARRRGVSVDFRLEPVEAVSFPDQRFDAVVSSFVYHHLPGDLKQRALASIARVLKPGGRLCIVDFMPRPRPGRPAPMATDMGALADLLGANGFTDITTGYGLPSLGLLVKALGLPQAGYVMARRAAEPGKQV